MKKLLLLTLLSHTFLIGQVQLGQDINGEAAQDRSGFSVSLSADGTVMAIGAPFNGANASGHVRVYFNQSGTWTQIGSDIGGEAPGDTSGRSVSLSSDGNTVAIGAPLNDGNGSDSGHVRVYSNQSGTWSQVGADINGEALNDQFGKSVSISSDGSVLAVGGPTNNTNGIHSGQVRVYKFQNGTWSQVGSDINGEASDDQLGTSLSISSDGKVLAIGAPFHDANGFESGHVKVYANQSGIWTQIGSNIDGEAPFDHTGFSVSLSSDGSILAIGTIGYSVSDFNIGHVRVFENQNGTWVQIGSDIVGEAAGDKSGWSVSLSSDGSIFATGAIQNNANGSNSGQVRVFKNLNDTWIQVGVDIDGQASEDNLGYSVSLSSDGSILAIGAPSNDTIGFNSGQVTVYNLSSLLSSNDFSISQVKLFPNPAKNHVTLELGPDVKYQNIYLYNNIGKLIMVTKNLVIDTSKLNSGVYYLVIKTNNGSKIKKLIIE